MDNGGFMALRVKGVADRETIVVLTLNRQFHTGLLPLLHPLLLKPSGRQLFCVSFPASDNRRISSKYCFGGIPPAFFRKKNRVGKFQHHLSCKNLQRCEVIVILWWLVVDKKCRLSSFGRPLLLFKSQAQVSFECLRLLKVL